MTEARSGEALVQRIERTIQQLAQEFAVTLSYETVQRCTYECFDRFQGAAVTEFVPVLTYRLARQRLLMAAGASGLQ